MFNALLELLKLIFGGTDNDSGNDNEQPEPDEPDTQPTPEPEPEPEPAPEPELEPLGLLEDSSAQKGQTRHSGVRIRTKQALEGLECRLSDRTSGVTMAYLKTVPGEIIESQPITDRTVRFTSSLESDSGYQVVCAAGGNVYERGRRIVDYPVKSEALDATHGIYSSGGSQSRKYRYNFAEIQPLTDSPRDAPVAGVSEGEPKPDYHSQKLRETTRAERCHIVRTGDGDGDALQVNYPEGETDGINERVYLENAVGYEPEVAHARYELYVPDDWEVWNDGINGGTKLPGWANQAEGGASGGHHNQGAAWSCRMNTPCQGGTYDGS
ncbi:hypothetical protein C484_10676, partial [Natrialba taiwanensis DSM 12281]